VSDVRSRLRLNFNLRRKLKFNLKIRFNEHLNVKIRLVNIEFPKIREYNTVGLIKNIKRIIDQKVKVV